MPRRDIKDMLGIQPELRDYLADIEAGLSGDMVIVVSPATLGSSAAAVTTAIAGDGFSRTVEVELQDSDGNVHEWFSGSLSVAVTETTAGSGTSAVEGSATTVPLTNGKGSVNVTYTGAWAAADTQTTTLSGTVLGKSLTSHTSVDTLVA